MGDHAVKHGLAVLGVFGFAVYLRITVAIAKLQKRVEDLEDKLKKTTLAG
jgi:hypothetical protein